MNQQLKILLEGEGFRQVRPQSCEFARLIHPFGYLHRVWLHRNGGQAEVCFDDTGKRLARLESWMSMDDLSAFFKEYQ